MNTDKLLTVFMKSTKQRIPIRQLYCITVIMRKITANMITFEAVNHIPYLKLYLKSMRVICFVSSSVISYRPH